MAAIPVTDETFEQEVLKSELPVIVDFYAQWCGPCKAMAPALDQVAEELEGKVKITKFDVDTSVGVTDTYGIRSMPTLILFKDGKPSAIYPGALVQKSKLAEWIDQVVNASGPALPTQLVEHKLSNGLQVLVIAKPGADKVIHQIFYKVGMGDDPEGRKGCASLVAKLMSRQTEAMGGADWPRVSTRTTGILQNVKSTLQAAMLKESDRMTALRISEQEMEAARQSAVDEWAGSADSPRARLALRMFESYAGEPIVDNTGVLSRDEIIDFHQRYYGPNNAVVVIAGDVDVADVKRLAEEIYGGIPRRADIVRAPRKTQQRPRIARRVNEVDNAATQGWFNRTYAVPAYGSASPGEAEALDLLVTILGRSGPLQRELVHRRQLAKRVTASYWGQESDGGQLSLSAIQGNATPEMLEAAIDEMLDAIRMKGVSEPELERAKEVYAAAQRVEDERTSSLAFRYGWFLADGRSVAEAEGWRAAVAMVTAEDIRKVACTYLDLSNSVTGWIVATGSTAPDNRAA